MKPHKSRRMQCDRGFTLLEALLALLMGGMVVAAVTQFYVNQHYHVTEQMSISDLQQNLRSAMQEITDQLRMAGYGMPSGMDPIVAFDSNPDTILFFYRKSPTSQAELQENMADPSVELRCTGEDLSEFQHGSWCYIWDPTAGGGEFVYMTSVDGTAGHIFHTVQPLSRSYPAGSQVIALEIYRYFVDRTDTLNPVLMRSRQGEGAHVFSEGIADLQFRYLESSGSWRNVPVAGRLVRSVEVTLVARDDQTDEEIVQGTRERSLTTAVNIRNLSM